ncbi:O-unit flippase-like protein [Parabacteroides sp. Marseille-P3160]|uniref:O-unit flippase-like protein n=1 Tax=Parabacteroides sp. Marseille-P3160 TaxID=1917887 RepID=UPI002714846F|nr:O-unit flippase-like protein [Parabacteroides sp. Marseille-P3160]
MFWSYLAQGVSIGSGLLVLPFILRLSNAEIGLNYLMITISSLVMLFDFGFSPQFGRNITYVFSGAKTLKKEGVDFSDDDREVDYRLLTTLIYTAKYVYKRIASIALFFLLTIGTVYIWEVTDHFVTVKHTLVIWVLYSLSVFFNIYFSYYNSLLIGKGFIKESQIATITSKTLYLLLTIGLIYAGWGLIGLAVANLISPFLGRYISYIYFYTKDLKHKIAGIKIEKREIKELFSIIWYNSKRIGLVSLGGFAVARVGLFLSGIYLSMEEVASYGLMLQLMGVISTISNTFVSVQGPTFASYRVKKDMLSLTKRFAFSMVVFYFLFFCGSFFMIFIVPKLLIFIHSNAILPALPILVLYCIISLLENNHGNFAGIILSNNSVPFFKISLISGGFVLLIQFLSLTFTSLGLLGLVLGPGLVQLAYNNWKWPMDVLKEFGISYLTFLKLGAKESIRLMKQVLTKTIQ